MVKLRLARHGAKKRPFYRLVATAATSPRDGRFLEQLGTYDPLPDPPHVKLKRDRIRHWLSRGARPTTTVRNLLDSYMDQPDTAPHPKAFKAPEPPSAEGKPAAAEADSADAKAEAGEPAAKATPKKEAGEAVGAGS